MSAKILYKKLNLKSKYDPYDSYHNNLGYLIFITMNRFDFNTYGMNRSYGGEHDESPVFTSLRESKKNPTRGDIYYDDKIRVFWKLSVLTKKVIIEYKFVPTSNIKINEITDKIKNNIDNFNEDLIDTIKMSISDENIFYMELAQVKTVVDPTKDDFLSIEYQFVYKNV